MSIGKGFSCGDNALIGRICISKAGHDKGEIYLIVSVIDHQHVGVADGKVRQIAEPKRKNLKHLWLTKSSVVEIERLLHGEAVSSNLKLDSIIKALKFDVNGREWKSN